MSNTVTMSEGEGELILAQHHNGPPWFHIERADKHIRITHDVLDSMTYPAARSNGFELDVDGTECRAAVCAMDKCFHGAALRIHADNMTVDYAITGYDPNADTWSASRI